jgi:hypothetical protein
MATVFGDDGEARINKEAAHLQPGGPQDPLNIRLPAHYFRIACKWPKLSAKQGINAIAKLAHIAQCGLAPA